MNLRCVLKKTPRQRATRTCVNEAFESARRGPLAAAAPRPGSLWRVRTIDAFDHRIGRSPQLAVERTIPAVRGRERRRVPPGCDEFARSKISARSARFGQSAFGRRFDLAALGGLVHGSSLRRFDRGRHGGEPSRRRGSGAL